MEAKSPPHAIKLTLAIDLCLSSVDIIGDFQMEVDEDLHGSNHFPMYLIRSEFSPQHQTPRWLINKANWEVFSEETQSITEIPDCSPLDYYNQVTEKIIEGAEKSIPKSDGFFKVAPVPWWNSTCENLKKERIRAQRKMIKHPTMGARRIFSKGGQTHTWVVSDLQQGGGGENFLKFSNSHKPCSTWVFILFHVVLQC